VESPPIPGAGNGSARKNVPPQIPLVEGPSPEDAVKVQWDKPDQVIIYQFVNQQGSVIVQVPSEQMLNLARQISQELAQEAAPKLPVRVEGGKNL
jgi:hypothetical protein